MDVSLIDTEGATPDATMCTALRRHSGGILKRASGWLAGKFALERQLRPILR